MKLLYQSTGKYSLEVATKLPFTCKWTESLLSYSRTMIPNYHDHDNHSALCICTYNLLCITSRDSTIYRYIAIS